MKAIRWAVVGLSLLALTSGAMGQTSDAAAKRSTEILKKARTLDLLNHILPLLLTKEQINQMLPAIERTRAKVRAIEKAEAEDLAKYEKKLDDAIAQGFEKERVPGRTVLNEISKLFQALAIRRQIAAEENAEDMLTVVKKALNAGQLKTMAGSLDMKVYLPGVDPATITEDMKIKVYIKDVLLDPLSYDFLVRLSRIKS